MTELGTKWVVIKIIDRPSKYGNYIKEVTFANTRGEIAHSYLDEDNRNYKRWQPIVDAYDEGRGIAVKGLKVKSNSQHKKTGEPLVNADSPVKPVAVTETRQQMLDALAEALETD